MRFDRRFRFSLVDSAMNIAVVTVALAMIGVIITHPDVLWIFT